MPETMVQEHAATERPTSGGAPSADEWLGPELARRLASPPVQASLVELLDNLPKVTELALFMTTVHDLAKTLAADALLREELVEGWQGLAQPVVHRLKSFASAAIEAGERASEERAAVGWLDLLGMLRDPQVQRGLRYLQTLLAVLTERAGVDPVD